MGTIFLGMAGWRLLGLLLSLALLGGLLLAGSVYAQGFSLFEQGTCAMGRAGATVAQSCNDGSAVFFNPAGLAAYPGATLTAGVTVVDARGEFADDATGESTDLANDPIPVPHAYAAYGVNDRLAAGLGVYVPYGLGTTWPTGFEGRFMGYDTRIQSIYIQPTVAYQVTDRISVGAGLSVVVGALELNQRADLSEQRAGGVLPLTLLGAPRSTDFAEARLEASGATGFGGNFGIQVQATDWLRLGARFLTPVTLTYEGDATFAPVAFSTSTWRLPANNPFGAQYAGLPVDAIPLPAGNPLGAPAGTPLGAAIQAGIQQQFSSSLRAQAVSTEIEMPAQLVVGAGIRANDQLLLLVDYQWTNWSSFETIPIDFEVASDVIRIENYHDTHAIRLGAEYTVDEAWQLRAGFVAHGPAAPDETVTPLLPEAGRYNVTVGVGWRPLEAASLNVAYQYLAQEGREGRVREDPAGGAPTTALNTGVYSFMAHLVGATLTVHF